MIADTSHNVIIVAGGKGLRMGAELPKQFLLIGEKPILMHTIEAFYSFDNKMNIVVVLPPSFRDYWSKICGEYGFTIKHTVADGGETRFHSVKNGLEFVKGGFVAVHDGARPFVSVKLIKDTFELVKAHQAVIPVTDVVDSLRELTAEGSKIIDRSHIKQVQTPQVFASDLLKKAYDVEFNDSFTDDASVVEHFGQAIYLTKGEVHNIKITTLFDLEVAKIILRQDE